MKKKISVAFALFSILVIVASIGCSVTGVELEPENRSSAMVQSVSDVTKTKYGRLTGVNWFGFETGGYAPHGLWTRDYKSMIQQIYDLGFNCVRLPWSNEMIGKYPNGIQVNQYGVDAYTNEMGMNVELDGLSSLEVLDKVIEECEKLGLYVILDNHSRSADGYMNETLWYNDEVSEEQWIADWVMLATRYQNNPFVIGYDLNNEPHGNNGMGQKPPAGWGYDHEGYPHTDWKAAAEKCGQAILAVNPDVLIMVEGVEEYKGETYWWGGNLQGVRDYPITGIPQENLIYSPHEYGPTVHQQIWFYVPEFPSNMPAIWDKQFWFIQKEGIGHLLFGEFGIKEEAAADPTSKDYIWFTEFLKYCGNDSSWTFWCMNPNSGDTGGILASDWVTVNEAKYNLLKPYLEPMGGDTTPPAVPTSLSAVAESYSSIVLDWADNSESDFAKYTVYRSATETGVYTKLADSTSSIFTDTGLTETTEYFYKITASDRSGNQSERTTFVSATTKVKPIDITPPAAPTGVTASEESSSIINIDWADNSELDLASYRVYRGLESSALSLVTTTTISAFNDSGLEKDTTYFYTITAVDTSGNESDDSIIVSAKTKDITVEGDIAVEYRNGTVEPNSQAIRPILNLKNSGTTTMMLDTVVLRYYFTPDMPLANYRAEVDYAAVGSDSISISFGGNETLAYLEVSFAATATIPTWAGGTGVPGELGVGGSTGDIQLRIFDGASWQNQDQSNDYSYGLQTAFENYDKVTGYLSGALSWGIEP